MKATNCAGKSTKLEPNLLKAFGMCHYSYTKAAYNAHDFKSVNIINTPITVLAYLSYDHRAAGPGERIH